MVFNRNIYVEDLIQWFQLFDISKKKSLPLVTI